MDPTSDFASISKHIKINKTNAAQNTTLGSNVSNVVMASPETPKISITDVISRIHAPYRVAKDSRGIVCDATVIGIICGKNHAHKYLIRDVLNSEIKCRTCIVGSQTIQIMRELVETTLAVPFVIAVDKYDSIDSIEFVNRKLALVISFVKKQMYSEPKQVECKASEHKIVRCYATRSLPKFRQELWDQLAAYPLLTDKQRVDLNALVGIYHDDPITNNILKVRAYDVAQLPVSEEMASAIVAKNPNINSTAMIMSLNIIPDADAKYLCIENC